MTINSSSPVLNSAVTLSSDGVLGIGGMGDKSSALAWSGSSTDALSVFMISYERSCVGLKPTWKANLRFLFLIATIVSASIFALATK